MEKTFTPEQLSRCDGKEGRPACVAVDGSIYDVSGSKLWAGGGHMKRHLAGRDLTAEIGAAPHGNEVLERPQIRRLGSLEPEAGTEQGIPAFLAALFQAFPMLRRHPHPMMVHFPMAYAMAGALFVVLDALVPALAPFEALAFAMLVLAALFTPLAIITGLVTWWVNYAAKPIRQVTRKLQFAVLMATAEVVCLALRIRGPVRGDVPETIYFVLMVFLAACAVALGWYGGQLTFPYERE